MSWHESLSAADERWSARLRIADRPGVLRTVAKFLAHSGDSWFWLAGLIVVWFVATPIWKYRAAVIVVGIIGTAVLVQILKLAFRRERPQGEWGAIYRKTDPHSFPSGHAARAGLLLGLSLWLGPAWFAAVLLFWTPLMPLSRVAMGVHYVLDIAAGFIFGFLISIGVGLALA